MDELLQKAADTIGMPPALAQRSAEARAAKEGTTVEAVLREWAGEPPASEVAGDPEPETTPPPVTEATPEPEAPAGGGAAPGEVTTDYLVALAADAKRMPPKLVRSSAEARARNSGSDVDTVLATWAGVDLADLRQRAAEGESLPVPAGAADPEPAARAEAPAQDSPAPAAAAEPPSSDETAAPAAAPAAAAAALSMDELLDKVSEAKGMPPALAKRSAEARAKKTGEPVEAVLAEWAGIDASAVAASTASAPATEAPSAPPATAATAPAPDTPSADDVEVYEAAVPDVAPVDHGEGGEDQFAEEPAGAAGDRRGGYPTWLAAAFVLIPLLAVAYVLVSPNGPDCGTAGQLDIDPATGLAVNCDGSEYGSSVVDFFAQGATIYAQCAACHGGAGEGGVGPAFSGGAVLATFPANQCSDHVEWVGLGTSGWPDATYGATNKPVGGGGVMPAFGNALTPEELRAVVLYERVQFGGEPLEEAQVDCGLVTPDGEIVPEDQMVQASDG